MQPIKHRDSQKTGMSTISPTMTKLQNSSSPAISRKCPGGAGPTSEAPSQRLLSPQNARNAFQNRNRWFLDPGTATADVKIYLRSSTDIFRPHRIHIKGNFSKNFRSFPLQSLYFFHWIFAPRVWYHMPGVYMIRFFRKNLKIGDTHGKKDDCV